MPLTKKERGAFQRFLNRFRSKKQQQTPVRGKRTRKNNGRTTLNFNKNNNNNFKNLVTPQSKPKEKSLEEVVQGAKRYYSSNVELGNILSKKPASVRQNARVQQQMDRKNAEKLEKLIPKLSLAEQKYIVKQFANGPDLPKEIRKQLPLWAFSEILGNIANPPKSKRSTKKKTKNQIEQEKIEKLIRKVKSRKNKPVKKVRFTSTNVAFPSATLNKSDLEGTRPITNLPFDFYNKMSNNEKRKYFSRKLNKSKKVLSNLKSKIKQNQKRSINTRTVVRAEKNLESPVEEVFLSKEDINELFKLQEAIKKREQEKEEANPNLNNEENIETSL